MRVCGIELSGTEARLAIAEKDDEGGARFLPCETKKLLLKDDRSSEAMKAFKEAFQAFVHENSVDVICIKSRAKKGTFAGGPVSFKIEAMIQLSDGCKLSFVSPQALSKFEKKNYAGLPDNMPKYLNTAFLCSAYILANN
jgi:hypothetical protein